MNSPALALPGIFWHLRARSSLTRSWTVLHSLSRTLSKLAAEHFPRQHGIIAVAGDYNPFGNFVVEVTYDTSAATFQHFASDNGFVTPRGSCPFRHLAMFKQE